VSSHHISALIVRMLDAHDRSCVFQLALYGGDWSTRPSA